ncbi:hypothetical protein [Nitrospirillum sp. BR 11828]|uniref:hypothetical protein n=1 Tax=Nitrospirillum sp. BR 11828 TaxID=3104325 RepID=UPI002ACA81B5|nr:hypothetical protein [Nitrospirillum sp. BR 11828]MDZ5648042.1 hypothetical protein [Nitrospirillum sp. BR 11828]
MTASPTPRRAALAFVFVTALLDVLALGIIIPVLPDLVKGFVGGDNARAAHMVGLFGTLFAAMQFLFSPSSARCPTGSAGGPSCWCPASGWGRTIC